jgi:hypothetical protein
MSNVSNQDVADQAKLSGWVIEGRRSHYSIGYWFMFVLGMLGQTVPSPPKITYTLRNSSSGERRLVTLPGDHGPSDLAAAARSGSAPGNG